MKELSQKTLRLLAQFTSEGVLILDREGNICRTNDTLKQIFGIPGNEMNVIQGFGVAELDLTNTESVDSLIIRADQYRIPNKVKLNLTVTQQ